MRKFENYHKLSQTYEVSHFAPHVGQNETIGLFQKSMKFSSYEILGRNCCAVVCFIC